MTTEAQEEKALILVVDDAPDNILLLTTILEPYYRIKVAINGQRALKIAFADDPPDLILLDVMMPDMDGYEVCRRLQADDKTRDIPVIFVTARTESADEVQGLALGAVDYISKPVMPPVVLARIRTHLALKHARADLEDVNSTLQQEKEVVENIVAKMHRAAPFDTRHVRYHLSSVDRTAGDMVFSAYGPDGQQHIMVGDFSGHGLPAAVAGPLVSYIFYQHTAAGKPLEVILAEINRTLQTQLPIQIYMAACAVEITPDRERATFWNHGLPPTLLLNKDGVKQRIAATEMPLGIIDPVEITPSVAAVKLAADDFIYIFSDGMTEITSPAGEEFGQPRLEPLLTSLAASREPLQSIWATLIEHRGGTDFPDDATLLEIAANG